MPPDDPRIVNPLRPGNAGGQTRIVTIVLLYAVFASIWILLSDRALGWLLSDPAHITLASIIKGWAFVAGTSLLLYGMMRRLFGPGEVQTGPIVGLRPLLLPIGLIAVSITALTAGGIINTVINEKEKEITKLQAIADLKTRSISNWFGERHGDIRLVRTHRSWLEFFRGWQDKGDVSDRDQLLKRLNELRESKSYRAALLLDESGNPLWSSEEGSSFNIEPVLSAAARRAAAENQPVHIGPYFDSAGRLNLDFMTPLIAADGGPVPVIVLRADPSDYLQNTLQSWPIPSDSSETLLFRRDGDDILYLNELRHAGNSALKLRVPVATEELVAGRFLRGKAAEGMPISGVDYRGVAAIGVVRNIPETDWALVAKVDKAELYANMGGHALWVAFAGLLALFVAIISAFLFRQRQELAASFREREIQAEKLRALHLLDSIAEGSADAIFAKDLEGRYLLFNREAARATGKPAAEVLGRGDALLFPPDQAALIKSNDREVMTKNRSLTFQEDLNTAVGEVTFLATKGPLHDAAGNVIGMFGISRDITERKRAEKERELTVEFLHLVNGSEDGKGLIRAAAAFFQERSGCEAAGIRLEEEGDYPYYEVRGFPAEFVKAENSLCVRLDTGEVMRDATGDPVLECMCGNVIRGRFDPSKPFFTKNGSFWTNSTTRLLAATTETDRQARTRNRCNGEGFESVALIPLCLGDERFGLLQLNDRRAGRFSAEDIALWERLSGYLTVTLAKFEAEELRRESEELLRAIIDNAESVIWFKDLDGRFRIVNSYAERITGKPEEELVGRTVFDIYPRELAEKYAASDLRVIDTGEALEVEEPARVGNEMRTLVAVRFPIRDRDGTIYGIGGICTDITDRKRAEELLRHQEMMLREAAEIAQIGAWEFDPVTLEGSWTEETARIHEVDPNDPITAPRGLSFYQGESLARIENAIREAIECGKPYDLELELISAKGTHKWVRAISHPIVRDGRVVRVRGSIQEITARKQAEEALRDSLEEKVSLLKEVHHRVKNNLQIVASLLSLQANRAGSPEAVGVLRDTVNRVRSMALLHEVLYRSANLARVNFAAYVRELCTQLHRSYGTASSRVKLENHVAEIGLALEQSVPCGLIISELVSNSLKHGFPADRRGRVTVELRSDGERMLVLNVSDDGVGLPPEFDPAGTSTLGLKLVSNLAGQLGGRLEIDRPLDGGTAFRVVFPVSEDTPL